MLSVIIPAWNEEQAVPLAAQRVAKVLAGADIDYELIFVDDGSSDGTWAAVEAARALDPRVVGVRFSRNFGKEAAMFAGLEEARGDACAVLDCDLQHPPEKLVEMVRLWEQGYEVVEGVKEDRGEESPLHRAGASCFYGLISRAAGFDLRGASDFKLLDRKVVDALNAMPERNVFFRALSHWAGYRRATVTYSVAERAAGTSKWSLRSLVKYAVTNLGSFTSAPLQIVGWVGLAFFVFAVVLGVQTLVRLLSGHALEGFTTVILLILLSAGLIMLSLGIIGFYIARIYEEVKGRPRYLVAEVARTGGPERS